MRRISAILLATVAACSSEMAAPSGAGLCWRMFEAAGPEPKFAIIARDVPNLESCAVQLEALRLMEGAPTSGAYNGHFIFASEQQITSAVALNGARVRIFEAEHRRQIQEGLRTLIERQRSADGTAS